MEVLNTSFGDQIKDFILKQLKMNAWTFLVHLACAALIIVFISLWVWKPTNDFINTQKRKLDKERSDLVLNNRETKYFLNLLRKERKEIFDTKRIIKEEAIKEADRIKSDARAYMEEQTTEWRKKTLERIKVMEEKAKDEIKNSVVKMAVELTEKLVEANINESNNKAIIDAYIKDLEQRQLSNPKL